MLQSLFLLQPLLVGSGGVAALSQGDICFTITLVVIAGADFDGWALARACPPTPLLLASLRTADTGSNKKKGKKM